MRTSYLTCAAVMLLTLHSVAAKETVIKTLLIDGQNNHQWQKTTPLIKAALEKTGRFAVDVATTPEKGGDMSKFSPKFADYQVVVSNYNGEPWSKETSAAFVAYVKNGGGFVAVHAADNSFLDWPEYNEMIGVGGWGGRNEKSGPYVRWREGKFDRDTQAGRGGSHGKRHPFEVVVRDTTHPITRGIPSFWMQAEDELYAELRGPAANMQVLATAFSDKATGGTGEHEPMLMAINFGKGRVFHTTLGHDTVAMSGAGFQVTLQRGTEWCATGEVTQPAVTAAQLTAKEVAMRDPLTLESPVGHDKADFSTPPNIAGEGWTALFNGKDLSGWAQKNGTAKYTVEDGTVVGRTSEGSPNSFMCTEKDYADFELTFEVKVDNALNSGVQIRSRSIPEKDNGRVHGPQVEIEAAPGTAGYVYGEGTGRGWLSPTQTKTDAFKNGQWNRYVIRAVGPRIQTWINGRKIEDIYDPTSYQSGFIGLQVHGIAKGTGPFQVQWRDIRVHEVK
ncbi:MAG: family 16 glycoside hydrolase [Pirellulaceae bacterium]|nr:family 16 glycoside hydrolase [Pirellulaceae bacterium]